MILLKAVLKIALNAGALYAADRLINGVTLAVSTNNLWDSLPIFALIGFVLWAANAVVKPILKLLTFPLVFVTFGLFNIVINMAVLWGVDLILPQLEIAGITPLIMATALITLINSLFFFL